MAVVPVFALVLACGGGDLTLQTEALEAADESTGAQALTSAAAGQVIRATAAVNLRQGPSTGYAVITVVPQGGVADVVSGTPQNAFFKIRFNGQTGWSHGAYWEHLPTVTATVAVNLRAGPSTSHAVLAVVPQGGVAAKLGQASNGWLYLRHGGKTGYSHPDYWKTGSSTPAPAPANLKVNGYTLTATQEKWVRHVAAQVVPRLEGTRAQRLEKAARVTWWSLKEGVLDLANPLVYSNCNTTSGDVRIGPTAICAPGRAWQVGISAVQVPGKDLNQVQQKALALYPGLNAYDVLWRAAKDAGLEPGTAQFNAVVSSTGALRLSWLLRNGPVGFTYEEPVVSWECITNSYGWCYGSGWTASARYAPSKTAALKSVDDLRGILGALAP